MSAFQTTKRVRFQHCDPAGIVFYPQYYQLFNEVVEDWFEEGLGIGFRKLHLEDHIAIPVRKTTAEFLAPSVLGDDLDCALSVDKVGGSSFTLTIRVTCAGEPRATVTQLLVQTSMLEKKPIAIADSLRAKMLAFATA